MRAWCYVLVVCFGLYCCDISSSFAAQATASTQQKSKRGSSKVSSKQSKSATQKAATSKTSDKKKKKAPSKKTSSADKNKSTSSKKSSSADKKKKSSSKKETAKSKKTKKSKSKKKSSKSSRQRNAVYALETPSFEDLNDDIPVQPQRFDLNPQVPVSVRGAGVNFERVIEVCLYSGNKWLLLNKSAVDVEDELAQLAPTFITGGVRFKAGEIPNKEMVNVWNALRTRLQGVNSVVGFDITIDLQQYATTDAVTQHMHQLGRLMLAEAWTLINMDQVARTKPDVLNAAIIEAKIQGRSVGGMVTDASLAKQLDYGIVVAGAAGNGLVDQGSSLLTAVKKQKANVDKPFYVLALNGTGSRPGEGFVLGKTPAERRKMVMSAAKVQRKGIVYAYPLFGPLAPNGTAYDATRDEFMVDTVRRGMKRYNPLSNRSIIVIGDMD